MTDPILNREGKGMVCARCDAWVQLAIVDPLGDIPHVTLGNEYSTLEPFSVVLYCPQCGDRTKGTGRNMTIDLKKQIIVHCDVAPVSGDMSPPDHVPDDLT